MNLKRILTEISKSACIIALLFAVITQSGQADTSAAKTDALSITIKEVILCSKGIPEMKKNVTDALRACLPQVDPEVVFKNSEPLTYICRLKNDQKHHLISLLASKDRRAMFIWFLSEFFSYDNICYGLSFYAKMFEALLEKNGSKEIDEFERNHREFLEVLKKCVTDGVRNPLKFRSILTNALSSETCIKDAVTRKQMLDFKVKHIDTMSGFTLAPLVARRLSTVN